MARSNRLTRRGLAVWLVLAALPGGLCVGTEPQDRATWMKQAKWGVMNHYLADWKAREAKEQMTVAKWNELIDAFDVEGLARQIESVGAGYYLITIGQNSGYYLSPNAVYDKSVGIQPSKCSRRDLVADLSQALHKRGIRLMVYLPAGAPNGDRVAREALQWQNGPYPNREFQLKWEQVIREWSTRWGSKVDGWWFDGCYWPNSMYRSTEPPNFASFAAAARAGNPESVIAFNPGVVPRILSVTPHEDYTAGEINDLDRVEIRRAVDGKIDGAQLHILSFLGERWGMGSPRFGTEQVVKWSQGIAKQNGVITWDVPIQPNGLMSEPFMEQLTAVGKALPRVGAGLAPSPVGRVRQVRQVGQARALPGKIEVDYRALVSRADLHYDKPVSRSEEGIPVGNGRMGSLVWTTPEAIRLQINRVDVFANNSYSTSFPARHSDYCGGCAFVDIAFGGDVFTNEKTSQHLSCYDGMTDVRGNEVAANVLAWNEQDVMALEVSDSREQPAAITAVLRMLRAPQVKTAAHTAISKIEQRDGRIILTQKFAEADYYCGSAIAVGIIGRKAKVQTANESEIHLAGEAGSGSFTILIASAASFDPKEDLVAAALRRLEAAEERGYAALAESNKRWWHDLWSKGFVQLHSEDGIADYIEQNYTYYLDVMASSSRGKFPAKFNGMIWITGGDKRSWGGQYWGANQECMYNALLPTNRMELLGPMFDMYWGMYDSCSVAARQQWGSKGIFIPETVAFDGLAKLPDDVAAEMRDLYLLKKPWDRRSEKFLAAARTGQPHSSRWNWMSGGKFVDGIWQPTERGGGPYGPVTHIFSRGAKIAYTFWQRYEYTLDKDWLRERAYPMLKGVAEFYRNYPNVKKDEDGKYHIHHVNSNESVQGGCDPDEEISSMMGILPAVIKASEILGVDADMRPVWKEFLDNLAPLATGGDPPVWIRALPPIFRGRGDGRPDGNTMPQWFFDLCTLENDDPETMRIANATMDGYLRGPDMRPGVLSKVPVTAAMMGRAEAVRYLLPNQLSFPDRAPILANRMDQREGAQTPNVERLGRVADTLHNALIQSVGAGPAKEPVIRVFPAWPKQWDAAFTLLVRGAFLVSSSMQGGKIEFVEVKSQAGGECRLRNPWPDMPVALERNGNKPEQLSGEPLRFLTTKGEVVMIRPSR